MDDIAAACISRALTRRCSEAFRRGPNRAAPSNTIIPFLQACSYGREFQVNVCAHYRLTIPLYMELLFGGNLFQRLFTMRASFTCPKMLSFVHGVSSASPTPLHHEFTASTWLHQHAVTTNLKLKALSPLGLDTVGNSEGEQRVLYAVVEGGEVQHVDASSRRWALALSTGPSPQSTSRYCSVNGRSQAWR